MSIKVLGHAMDLRTNTPVIYAKLPIPDYLYIVGENFTDFEIQRRREKHKAYNRLKRDVLNGALLPSITLALKLDLVDTFLPLLEREDYAAIENLLSQSEQVHILDGLQRTFILNDLVNEGKEFQEGQTLLVEFWLEKNIRNLIYRIIVLNAGQKPMSMRHQIELLFITVQEKLEREIQGLEIFTEREGVRRNRARKFPLHRIATAYQCFVTRTPEVQRENLVAQRLVEEDILESSEEELGEQFDRFVGYLALYSDLDVEVCRVYARDMEQIPSGVNWFGSDNVMNSFFAAVADFGSNAERLDRVERACVVLLRMLIESQEGDDPLGLATLQKIIQGINARKVNVGFATRKLLSGGFKEFFREEGETPLEKCWLYEAV